jgi:hypothetical protein
MKTFHTIFLILFLPIVYPLSVFSQTEKSLINPVQLHGLVLDSALKKPLAYVNIGISNQSVGTVSDINGHFDLTIPNSYLNDTLRVSMVGYHSIEIAIRQLKDTALIHLTKKIIELKEVVISKKIQHTEIVGMQSERSLFQVPLIPNGGKIPIIGAESGLKIKSKQYPALLNNFNFYVSGNNFKYIKFRLNIYSLKNNLPDAFLFNDEILISLKDYKTGWNQIDLTPYHMVVKADFAATLQWVDYNIDMAEKPQILIPAALSLSHVGYFRTTSLDKWSSVKGNLSFFVTLQY